MRYLASKCLWFLQGLPLLATAGKPLASEPMNTTQSPTADYLVQFGLGLAVVLITVVVLVWVLRRVGQLQSSIGGSLKTVGGLSLGARERIVLVQVGNTQLLLGVAPGRIQTLLVLDTPLEKTSNPQDGELRSKFARHLNSVINKSTDKQDVK